MILIRLDEAEVAGWEFQRPVGANHAEEAVAEGGGHDFGVAVAGDAVGDDAGQGDVGPIGGKAMDQCGQGLGLVAGIDDENHRQAESRRQIGRRTRGAMGAIEEAHDALDDDEVGIAAGRLEEGGTARLAHGPGIEIGAGPARGMGMKARVDVVGADLGRGDS